MRIIVAATVCAAFMTTTGVASAEVLGLPWSTWGELSYASGGNVDKGTIFTTYGEQGIDWLRLCNSGCVFNTFAGVEVSASDHSAEYWNNKARPSIGMKIRHSFDGDGKWGEVALGVRGERDQYFTYTAGNDWRAVAFVQWSAGGDWKKGR